jgi:hypothetical protein
MLTETEAYRAAVAWVRDEIETSTCIAGEEATAAADSFVSGMLHGLRMGGQGQLVVQGTTAEAFWRGNYCAALKWDRAHFMGLEDDEIEVAN